MHDHDHDHEHDIKTEEGENKDRLILTYMLEHNKQHTKELVELAVKLENEGENDTATIILNAVFDFETGNDKLATAIKTL